MSDDPTNHYSHDKVRSAVGYFLVGKMAAGLLAFATLILLVRFMTVSEYGAYVGLIAARGILSMLASLGLDGMAARFLPEFRITSADSTLSTVTIGVVATWMLTLGLIGLVIWLSPVGLLSVLHLEDWASLGPMFASLIVVGGLANFSAGILEALLLQKSAQLAATLSSTARLASLVTPVLQGHVQLADALLAELIGNATMLALTLMTLVAYFATPRSHPDARAPADRTAILRMGRFSAMNYGGQIVRQAQGPHGLRVAVASTLGTAASAQFGFVMSLADTLQRYLPTVLLAGVIRPVLVSRHIGSGGFDTVNRFASLLFKVNLLIVAPALALTVVHGADLVSLLGGDKYYDARWLLPAAFTLLLSFSHSVIISLVANTIEENGLQLWGGGIAVAGLGLGIWLAILLPVGAYGIIAGTLAGSLLYNFFSVRYLRARGYPYAIDWLTAARILFAAAASTGMARLAGVEVDSSIISLTITLLAGGASYVAILRRLRPFDAIDQTHLAQVLPGRLVRLVAPFCR
jgi:O-antigen/teichoic acid export membrane protein